MQFADESGKLFLLRPKKALKSRNKPGSAETSKRGSVTNFQGAPNGSRPALVCIRCGGPVHFVKDCPHPYRPVLDPRFATNITKQQKSVHFSNESADRETQNPPCIPCGNPPDSTEQTEPAQTMVLDESLGESPGPTDDELYNLWSNFYKAQNEHVIQMVAEIVCFELKTAEFGASEVNRSPISIDSGASRSVCGRKWAENGPECKNWNVNLVKNIFALGRALP